MSDTSHRALIVGAGPVGLVCANALADAGIPVAMIEASRELPKDLRASAFHPPTLDMLDSLGVSQTLVDRGLVCPTWQFRDRATGVVATFDLGMLADETAHPYRLQCKRWKLTEALRARLEGRAEVIYEATVEEFSDDDDGVSLTIGLPDGARQTLRGRYLVGADGARSARVMPVSGTIQAIAPDAAPSAACVSAQALHGPCHRRDRIPRFGGLQADRKYIFACSNQDI